MFVKNCVNKKARSFQNNDEKKNVTDSWVFHMMEYQDHTEKN